MKRETRYGERERDRKRESREEKERDRGEIKETRGPRSWQIQLDSRGLGQLWQCRYVNLRLGLPENKVNIYHTTFARCYICLVYM